METGSSNLATRPKFFPISVAQGPESKSSASQHLPPNKQSLEVESSSINMQIANYGSSVSPRSRRHTDSDSAPSPRDGDGDGYTPPPPIRTPDPRPSQFDGYFRNFPVECEVAVAVLYGLLQTHFELMFIKGTQSPFETHGAFMYSSAIMLVIAIITNGLLSRIKESPQSSMAKTLSTPIRYMILKSVFCCSVILAPFLLLLVLIIPIDHNWIAHSTICGLFVVIVACNFYDYLKFRNTSNGVEREPNLEAHQIV